MPGPGKRRASNIERPEDSAVESRDDLFMDIDRMVNEGLGGGNVTMDNGLIDDSTTEEMDILD
jgi:hypothetical protein